MCGRKGLAHTGVNQHLLCVCSCRGCQETQNSPHPAASCRPPEHQCDTASLFLSLLGASTWGCLASCRHLPLVLVGLVGGPPPSGSFNPRGLCLSRAPSTRLLPPTPLSVQTPGRGRWSLDLPASRGLLASGPAGSQVSGLRQEVCDHLPGCPW